ncbi:MAG TPA: chorismate mutase [Candidatus Rifleibacterium sp.]|nr:chorismate mutase [Candidatus Rifleibacterium sp.]HPW57166.1 chorismate mutase [Candidatus Rifleibacterium sp.]
MTSRTLEELRKNLDRIDQGLIELIRQRIDLAREIGGVKRASGFEACFAPIREADVFKNLDRYNLAGLNRQSLENIFVEVVSTCRAAQEQGRIAVLGERNGWFYDAALSRFGQSADVVAVDNFDDFCVELGKSPKNLGFASFTPEHSPDRLALVETMLSGKLGIVEEYNFTPEFSLVSNSARDLSEANEICVTSETLRLMRQFFITLSFDLKIKICRSMSEVCENLESVNPVAAILPSKLVDTYQNLVVIKTGLKSEQMPRVKFLTLSSGAGNEYRPGIKTAIMCPLNRGSEHIYDIVAFMRDHRLEITDIHNLNFVDKPWDTIVIIELILPEDKAKFDALMAEFQQRGLLARNCGFFPVFK